MTHLFDLMDPAALDQRVTDRYVNRRSDPRGTGYTLYDYSQHAQFDRVWDDVTTQCRGLIVDADGNVIARPFRKFFNLGEAETIPDGEFVAQEKMDGSLGIGYLLPDGTPAVATRGSFTSEQALWATEWLHADSARADFVRSTVERGETPLFEIIYPENRIVVDYGTKADLTLLASIDIATGVDRRPWVDLWPGPVAPTYPGLDLEAVTTMQRDNAEGFVLRWEDGTRLKVKHDEYVRLHRLITGVNARHIWEMLSNHMRIDQLIDRVPDEFFGWVKRVETDLNQAFTEIERESLATLATVDRSAPRKEQAEVIKASKYPGIVFAMLDGKNYSPMIWKMVRPEASLPFKVAES